MKRTTYQVVLANAAGVPMRHERTYAHNSGVRKSEALVREYARELGTSFHGDRPVRDESGYRREWDNGAGITVTALVYVMPEDR